MNENNAQQKTCTTDTPKTIAEATGAGTEYGDKRDRLALLLYELYRGPRGWEQADEVLKSHYVADADATLQNLPHLLSMGERDRLAELLPALAF